MIVESVDKIPTTLQGIFDHVSEHLLTQKKACMANGRCAYREDLNPYSPVACAAGSLIPTSLYSISYEQKIFVCNSVYDELRLKGFPKLSRECLELINYLQKIHDFSSPSQWKCKLSYLAGKYGLAESKHGN